VLVHYGVQVTSVANRIRGRSSGVRS